MRATAALRFPFARVFVINLDRRPDRWAFARRQLLEVAKVPASLVQRVAAVDGAAVSTDALYASGLVSALGRHRLMEPPGHRIWGMDLNAGAVGCALSHVKLWATIAAAASYAAGPAADGHPPAFLILEDDSLLREDFCDELPRRLSAVPRDWELLYLSGLDTARQCPQLRVAPGVCRVPQFHRTTNCYAVTAAGARRLLTECLPLTYQLDTMMTVAVQPDPAGRLALPFVSAPVSYTLRPPLVVQATRFGSDIQEDTGAPPAAAAAEERARCRDAGWTE